MPLFRRKKDVSDANLKAAAAPAIPGLDLPGNQSILNLAGTHQFGGVTDAETRSSFENGGGAVDDAVAGRTNEAEQPKQPTAAEKRATGPRPASAAAAQTGKGGDTFTRKGKASRDVGATSLDRKYGTMSNISAVAQGFASTATPTESDDSAFTIVHRPSSSSLSRSMSSGAVPYHLPWTRQLPRQAQGSSSPATGTATSAGQRPGSAAASMGRSETVTGANVTPPRRRRQQDSSLQGTSSPPSSFYNANVIPGLFNAPPDFRTSPASVQQPSPAQRRRLMDTARHMSLKRSKAASELNIMITGETNTGKTSFVRALLATCDLSSCSEEAKIAASNFGVSLDPSHPTHDTDPITPLRTAQFNILAGIDLHPSSLVPIAALESGASLPELFPKVRPQSVFSNSRTSTATGSGRSGRIQLSICDTPGIDFELEDEFEIERKTTAMLRHVEDRLLKTLVEENKVQRQQRGEAHIHLILYFIDPRFLLDRTAARKARRDKIRYAATLRAAASQAAKEQQQKQSQQQQQQVRGPTQPRLRSTSLSHQRASSNGTAPGSSGGNGNGNGSLSKQAQTAQLRQSMELLQARSAAPPKADGAERSPKDADGPTDYLGEDDGLTENEEVGVEGLSQSQISILARLSERANVLPIIAKADTLTQQEIDDVRTAVRNSIIRANLDLGAFEVEGSRKQKKESYDQYRPQKQTVDAHEDDATATSALDTSDTAAEPVKVIRIKPRRSYSATGGERLGTATSVQSASGHGGQDTVDGKDDGQSLGHTTPLFDGRVDVDEDEQDDVPSKEALTKSLPLTLFVPEPIRVRERQAVRPTNGGPQRKGSMNSIAESLPPVPPLPREIADMKHKAKGDSVSNSETGMSASSVEQEEVQEILQATDGTADLDEESPVEGRSSMDSALTRGALSTDASASPSKKISIATPKAPVVPPRRTARPIANLPPEPSRRFQRSFRFGNANVLDANQCDFSLLRTCILGSHVDALRDVTNERYERFRSVRLELRRQNLARLPSTTSNPALYKSPPPQTR